MNRLSIRLSNMFDILLSDKPVSLWFAQTFLNEFECINNTSVYQAYNENNEISCTTMDVSFKDNSLLHLEFDLDTNLLTVNSPY